MTDIILGMGQVGETLFQLLKDREFDCIGIDSDNSKCENYSENSTIENPEFLHVCLPGELVEFKEVTLSWINKIKDLKVIVIHSTVKPGTTKKIQEKSNIPVLYSPIRGVHTKFLEDTKYYTKFVASDEKQIDTEIKLGFKKRFQKVEWMSNTKTAEFAKILVDTTYYGWLISYAQITKMICEKEDVDFDEMWKFADEIQENLHNRPKMYPGIIGGHCVIPNLSLIKNEHIDMIKKINEVYEKFKK